MSTNLPPFTIIASSDHNGDVAVYAYDADFARVLIDRAVRTRGVGTVVVEVNQIEVGRFNRDRDDDTVLTDLKDSLDEAVAA